MRFLLDVNVGSRIAQALTTAGHDVVRAALVSATAKDQAILAHAVSDARILVTYDRDFSELVFADSAEPPPAIIYIRYRAREIEGVIERLMPLLDFDRLRYHMTVIDDRRVRRTPFPARTNDHA